VGGYLRTLEDAMARYERVDVLKVFGDVRYAALVEKARSQEPNTKYLLEGKCLGWVRDDGWVCGGFTKHFDALRFDPPKTPLTAEQAKAASYV
jgi:hypothetical protein